MTDPEVKGWCPGAWKPMQSGDGWITRIRPWYGRVNAEQLAGIADLSRRYGNGQINLTARANIQVRGVQPENQQVLLDGLMALDLLDADGDREGRRNVILSPFWQVKDSSLDLAQDLTARLQDIKLQGLPGKFGFAIEAPGLAWMQNISADIRLFVQPGGTVLVALDGDDHGQTVTAGEAAQLAVDLAAWFLSSGGVVNGRGRMKPFLNGGAKRPAFFTPDTPLPEASSETVIPGTNANGFLTAIPYGRATADDFSWLATHGKHFRVTPWHMLLMEDCSILPDHPGIITGPGDNRLRMAVCTGAPDCWQGLGDTLALAEDLAALLPEQVFLHISGCAKGCVNRPAVTDHVIATSNGYDLVQDRDIKTQPAARGLNAAQLRQILKTNQAE